MLVWKVVNRDRLSATVRSQSDYEYILRYPIGATVWARPKTLGVFCFETYAQALGFRQIQLGDRVIQVEGLGLGTRPVFVHQWWGFVGLADFYKDRIGGSLAPAGTICFPAVRVLE